MATNPKNSSLFTFLTICVILLSLSLIACTQHNEDGVWIPLPKDTSSLGRINHFIPKADLEKFEAQYRPERDSLKKHFPDLSMPMSEAFNKPALIEILKDPKSVGIRVYYAIKPGSKGNQFRMILVGVDEQGNDLYYQQGSGAAAQAGGNQGFGGTEYGQCNPPCDSIP